MNMYMHCIVVVTSTKKEGRGFQRTEAVFWNTLTLKHLLLVSFGVGRQKQVCKAKQRQ